MELKEPIKKYPDAFTFLDGKEVKTLKDWGLCR